jgi:hypothetical protein
MKIEAQGAISWKSGRGKQQVFPSSYLSDLSYTAHFFQKLNFDSFSRNAAHIAPMPN